MFYFVLDFLSLLYFCLLKLVALISIDCNKHHPQVKHDGFECNDEFACFQELHIFGQPAWLGRLICHHTGIEMAENHFTNIDAFLRRHFTKALAFVQ